MTDIRETNYSEVHFALTKLLTTEPDDCTLIERSLLRTVDNVRFTLNYGDRCLSPNTELDCDAISSQCTHFIETYAAGLINSPTECKIGSETLNKLACALFSSPSRWNNEVSSYVESEGSRFAPAICVAAQERVVLTKAARGTRDVVMVCAHLSVIELHELQIIVPLLAIYGEEVRRRVFRAVPESSVVLDAVTVFVSIGTLMCSGSVGSTPLQELYPEGHALNPVANMGFVFRLCEVIEQAHPIPKPAQESPTLCLLTGCPVCPLTGQVKNRCPVVPCHSCPIARCAKWAQQGDSPL